MHLLILALFRDAQNDPFLKFPTRNVLMTAQFHCFPILVRVCLF